MIQYDLYTVIIEKRHHCKKGYSGRHHRLEEDPGTDNSVSILSSDNAPYTKFWSRT